MKKLLVYLKDYKKESILGPLFKLLEASFELLVPLVVTKIIDVGIATGDVHSSAPSRRSISRRRPPSALRPG